MSVSFDPRRGLVPVAVRLSGPAGDARVRLALDTGAIGTMVSRNTMVALGYDPERGADEVRMTTGSGVESVPRIVVQRVEALGQTRENLSVVCHDLPPTASVDGVLGLDFLRGLCLTVDFRQGLITLE